VLADRYRLDDRIAAGGMGEVWRAVDLVLGRPVAVKLLREDYAQHPETLERFRAEARHTAAVSHPGIARMYDYGEPSPGQPPFLVMELVQGSPLTRLLERGPLEPARAMDIVAQAAAGLEAAHAAGLVHRDIKPGNLLVSPDDTVKITDFGIAYAAGSAPLTRTGTLIGTPAYLAPERVTGSSAGPASDLYSLGIVAYECLSGAQPFTGTPMEVALSHQYQPLPPLPPGVPPSAAALVAELTARDPARRPADAGEVAARAARLRDALGGVAETRADPWSAGQADPWPAGQADPWPASPAAAEDPRLAAADPGLTAAEPRMAAAEPWLAAPAHSYLASAEDSRYGTQPAAWAGPLGESGETSAATLHDVGLDRTATYGLQDPPPRGGRGRRARRRDARRPAGGRGLLLLAAAAVAVIVGLGGWLLIAGATSSAPPAPRHTSAARHTPSRPTTAAKNLVEVPGGLIGQPYGPVVQQLRQLGLQVKLNFVPSDQDHGTVLGVQPGGKVKVGTTIVVTVAAHHHHHDGGDGGNGFQGGQ
jgi:eukaryotic-like serine/threonine-protein kinase